MPRLTGLLPAALGARGPSSHNGKPLQDAAAGNAALTDLLEVCALCNDARITYNEVRLVGRAGV